MQLLPNLFHWAIANRAPLLQLLSILAAIAVAIGALCGWLANRYADRPKVAAAFSIGAAWMGDIVKFIDSVAILFSRLPPMLGRRFRKLPAMSDTLREDDPDRTGPFVTRIGLAVAMMFIVCAIGFVCTGCPSGAYPSNATWSKVVTEIDKGVTTFEQIAEDIGVEIGVVESIVSDLTDAEASPHADGSVGLTLPTDFHQKLLAVHHAPDGGGN